MRLRSHQSGSARTKMSCIADVTIKAVNSLREQIEDQCRTIGEEEVRRMVADGWGLMQWITNDEETLTLHMQIRRITGEQFLPAARVKITGISTH
jgi:hypothetical protein